MGRAGNAPNSNMTVVTLSAISRRKVVSRVARIIFSTLLLSPPDLRCLGLRLSKNMLMCVILKKYQEKVGGSLGFVSVPECLLVTPHSVP